jgi:hypothetical protein
VLVVLLAVQEELPLQLLELLAELLVLAFQEQALLAYDCLE